MILNALLMGASIFVVLKGSEWLHTHSGLAPYRGHIRLLAIAAVFGIPARVFLRNARHARIRGNSIAITAELLPQIHAILRSHCEKLGMERLPELYFSDKELKVPPGRTSHGSANTSSCRRRFCSPIYAPSSPFSLFGLGANSDLYD